MVSISNEAMLLKQQLLLQVDASAKVKLTNISSRRMVHIDRDIQQAEIVRYTHLPYEVLADPPAAYTPTSEMYSIAIMMWEAWTQRYAYRDLITRDDDPLDTIDKFVAHIETKRPPVESFYNEEGKPKSPYAETWLKRMQQGWPETERISIKAWLQLMEDNKSLDALHIKEQHFS